MVKPISFPVAIKVDEVLAAYLIRAKDMCSREPVQPDDLAMLYSDEEGFRAGAESLDNPVLEDDGVYSIPDAMDALRVEAALRTVETADFAGALLYLSGGSFPPGTELVENFSRCPLCLIVPRGSGDLVPSPDAFVDQVRASLEDTFPGWIPDDLPIAERLVAVSGWSES